MHCPNSKPELESRRFDNYHQFLLLFNVNLFIKIFLSYLHTNKLTEIYVWIGNYFKCTKNHVNVQETTWRNLIVLLLIVWNLIWSIQAWRLIQFFFVAKYCCCAIAIFQTWLCKQTNKPNVENFYPNFRVISIKRWMISRNQQVTLKLSTRLVLNSLKWSVALL